MWRQASPLHAHRQHCAIFRLFDFRHRCNGMFSGCFFFPLSPLWRLACKPAKVSSQRQNTLLHFLLHPNGGFWEEKHHKLTFFNAKQFARHKTSINAIICRDACSAHVKAVSFHSLVGFACIRVNRGPLPWARDLRRSTHFLARRSPTSLQWLPSKQTLAQPSPDERWQVRLRVITHPAQVSCQHLSTGHTHSQRDSILPFFSFFFLFFFR